MNRGTETPLTDRELHYLTLLWKRGWREGDVTAVGWVCKECYATSNNKTAVQHLPGCVFHGLDARTLAAISADWTPA